MVMKKKSLQLFTIHESEKKGCLLSDNNNPIQLPDLHKSTKNSATRPIISQRNKKVQFTLIYMVIAISIFVTFLQSAPNSQLSTKINLNQIVNSEVYAPLLNNAK